MAEQEHPETASSIELARKLRDLLGKGARRVRIEPGPPVPKLGVIGLLAQKGPLSTNDLAALERVRPQSMTATVKSLEEQGWVSRREHPTDRRKTLIEATPLGLEMLSNVFSTRENWLTVLISEQLNDAERADLQRGLRVIEKVILAS